jgi:hypothetical protein
MRLSDMTASLPSSNLFERLADGYDSFAACFCPPEVK